MEENNDMSGYIHTFIIIFLIITFIACWKYAFQDIEYTNRTTDNEKGLLPCPFCGSNNIMLRDLQECSYYVRCENCKCSTEYYDKCSFCEIKDCNGNNCPLEAIKDAKLCAIRDWNRRV